MRFLILLIFLLFSQNALSHEWYPIECCDKKDCAEIIKMELITEPYSSNPQYRVYTKFGSAIWNPKIVSPNVTNTDRLIYPPDEKKHACIIGNTLVCIFLPSGQ